MAGFSKSLNKRFVHNTDSKPVSGEGCAKIKKQRHPTLVKKKSKISKKRSKRKISKIEKNGLNSDFIFNSLQHVHNFIGVFAQDQLSLIKFVKIPFSVVINLDYSDQTGSHWLSIHVSRGTIEIFDSLGFKYKYFNNYPLLIISFINRFSFNRKILCSPVLQPSSSKLCGLYAIYFVIFRQNHSFESCLARFSSHLKENDQSVIDYFK